MRLFYEHGQTQVSMPLAELDKVIEEAKNSVAAITSPSADGSTVGRKRMGGRARGVRPASRKRMASRRSVSAAVLKRRRAGLAKARAVLAAKRKKEKAHRRQPKDWGPAIAKRNATIRARREAAELQTAAQSNVAEPMAATQ